MAFDSIQGWGLGRWGCWYLSVQGRGPRSRSLDLTLRSRRAGVVPSRLKVGVPGPALSSHHADYHCMGSVATALRGCLVLRVFGSPSAGKHRSQNFCKYDLGKVRSGLNVFKTMRRYCRLSLLPLLATFAHKLVWGADPLKLAFGTTSLASRLLSKTLGPGLLQGKEARRQAFGR